MESNATLRASKPEEEESVPVRPGHEFRDRGERPVDRALELEARVEDGDPVHFGCRSRLIGDAGW